MPKILVAPLTEVMTDSEIEKLKLALENLDLSIPEQTDDLDMGYEIETEEDSMIELMDALDSEAASADLYVPADLPEIIKIGDFRVYSLSSLIDALESVQETLNIEESEDDEDNVSPLYDEESDDDVIDDDFASVRYHIKRLWFKMYKFANDALENDSNLIVTP